MHIHFTFDGPFSTVRDELNARQKQVVGDTRAEARLTREILDHLAIDCLDAAQEAWVQMKDPKAPHPIVKGEVDVTITFTRSSA